VGVRRVIVGASVVDFAHGFPGRADKVLDHGDEKQLTARALGDGQRGRERPFPGVPIVDGDDDSVISLGSPVDRDEPAQNVGAVEVARESVLSIHHRDDLVPPLQHRRDRLT